MKTCRNTSAITASNKYLGKCVLVLDWSEAGQRELREKIEREILNIQGWDKDCFDHDMRECWDNLNDAVIRALAHGDGKEGAS